jgi:hypothetical protein
MMPAVVFLDQRDSGASRDLVSAWIASTAHDPTLRFLLPFERTAGDEVEALVADPETLAEVVRRALETEDWWVGVGVGSVVEPLPTSVRESRGDAFTLGREAIEAAKSKRGSGVRVLAQEEERGQLFEDATVLLADIYTRRSPGAREVATLRRLGMSAVEIAARLGISRQAVTKHLKSGRWREEEAAVRIALHLARELLR